MNFVALIQLYRSRPAFRALLDSVVSDGLDENRTTVDELLADGETTRRQAVVLLRDLEAMGCGEFKVGRKGHPSRFEWSVDAAALAQRLANDELPETPQAEAGDDDDDDSDDTTAVETDDEPVAESPTPKTPAQAAFFELDEPPRRAPARAGKAVPSNGASEPITHQYVLRPQLRVQLQLPSDLTAREAEVLAAWVRNLSFER